LGGGSQLLVLAALGQQAATLFGRFIAGMIRLDSI